ncbi:MAG: Universal stress protein F [Gammaproteobacteria bacterium]|nr:Universal stress protein F [Gammaproteobacteria bacterium]
MYKEILLSIDLEDENSWRKALPTTVEYAKAFGSRVHVVTVVPEFGMVRQFFPDNYENELMESVQTKLYEFTVDKIPNDIPVQHVIAHGTIYEEIDKTAEKVNADLIIMASHRLELGDYLLGPNAAKVVRHSKRSVLVVR